METEQGGRDKRIEIEMTIRKNDVAVHAWASAPRIVAAVSLSRPG